MPQRVDTPSLIPDDVWTAFRDEQADAARYTSIESMPVVDPDEVMPADYVLGQIELQSAEADVAVTALVRVPMFVDLAKPLLANLVVEARQGEIGPGQYLFVEGERANSFFVVIDGTIEIVRRREGREVVLRHMQAGEAVGLFGLFSAQVRAASARAIGEVQVLEIPAGALSELLSADDTLQSRMMTFYRERLLEGFVGASTLFSDVDSIARARVLGRFNEKSLAGNETLLNPGEVANLLAVVLSGRVTLETREGAGQAPQQYEVWPGQFVAVTTALTGRPSRVRVFAPDPATVALLTHRDLVELLRDYPTLRSIGSRLSGIANMLARDVYCGHTGVPGT